jgi:hypothetical protein
MNVLLLLIRRMWFGVSDGVQLALKLMPLFKYQLCMAILAPLFLLSSVLASNNFGV